MLFNRRATAVVFSLEHQDKVIGRQILSCRICSCPKRDKKSQENAFMKNSIEKSPSSIHLVQPPKKKPKMMMYQHNSAAVITSPVIEQMKLPTAMWVRLLFAFVKSFFLWFPGFFYLAKLDVIFFLHSFLTTKNIFPSKVKWKNIFCNQKAMKKKNDV